MNGLAVTILVGQLPKLFGFSIDADGFIDETKGFVNGVRDGETVTAALAIGLVGIALIIVLQRFLPKLPGVLAAVVLSIVAARVFHLDEHGVKLVGTLPQGFPPLTIPSVHLSDLSLLIGGALGHRDRHARRHDRDGVRVRHANRTGVRRQPGDDRHRRGQHRRRLLPGLPGQHERITDGRRRAVGREDAGDRARRSARDRADARARAGPAAEPAAAHARSRRDRRIALARRHPGDRPALAPAPRGLPRVDRRLPRSGPARRAGRHRRRRCAVDRRACSGMPGGPTRQCSAASTASPATTISPAIPTPQCFPASCCSASTPRSSSRTRGRSAIRSASSPRPTRRRRWIVVAAEPITDVDTTAADMLEELDHDLNARGVSLVFAEMKDPVREQDRRATTSPARSIRSTSSRRSTPLSPRIGRRADRPAGQARASVACCRSRIGSRGTTAAGCAAT